MIKLFFLISSLILSFAGQAEASSGSAVVESVIDGRTLKLSDGRTVRMIGVVSQRPDLEAGEADESKFLYRSRKYIRKTVEGKPVILSYDPVYKRRGHQDRSGRVLAYVWYSIYFREAESSEEGAPFGISAKEKMLNAEVIKQGYGFADRSIEYNQKNAFLRYEKQAEEASRGLWRASSDDYVGLLEHALGSRSASASKGIPVSARLLGFETAQKAFQQAIDFNPNDYRAYYERSWLGADPINDSVTEEHLTDINRAIKLSPRNPKCYAQKHYVLRLLGRHSEASRAYEKAVDLAAKLGMISIVTGLVNDKHYTGEYPFFPDDELFGGFVKDGLRATLNEDHFLFFMSRYKSRNLPVTDATESFFNQLLQDSKFQTFYQKHASFVDTASPHEIIYKTRWAQEAADSPEDVLKSLERETK